MSDPEITNTLAENGNGQEPEKKNKRSFSDQMARMVAIVIHFFLTIPYKKIARNIITRLGSIMNWLTFKVVLPKRLRTLTKHDIFTIIFKSDTPAGKKFDIWILIIIGLNILVMMLDSYEGVSGGFSVTLRVIEWLFTILFTFEYYLRIYCLKKPMRYVFSFFGIIDFLSIFPAYLSLFFPTARALSVLRILRALRIFRILKLDQFLEEGSLLINAIHKSMKRIVIFMMLVFFLAIILGAVVFSLESKVEGTPFTSIPMGIYWAVVTITTVGYGDITPQTPGGQIISVIVMLLGYSIIAIPSGIVVESTMEAKQEADEEKKKRRVLEPGSAPTSNNDDDDDDDDEANEVLSNIDMRRPATKTANTAVSNEEDKKANDSPTPTQPTQIESAMDISEEPDPDPLFCKHCGYEEHDPTATFCSRCGTRLSKNEQLSWVRTFFRS